MVAYSYFLILRKYLRYFLLGNDAEKLNVRFSYLFDYRIISNIVNSTVA